MRLSYLRKRSEIQRKGTTVAFFVLIESLLPMKKDEPLNEEVEKEVIIKFAPW